MRAPQENALARALRKFFSDHLPRLRGLSPHTIHSYRDSFTLLLRFLTSKRSRPVAKLDLTDIEAEDVVAFLDYLEEERQNTLVDDPQQRSGQVGGDLGGSAVSADDGVEEPPCRRCVSPA